MDCRRAVKFFDTFEMVQRGRGSRPVALRRELDGKLQVGDMQFPDMLLLDEQGDSMSTDFSSNPQFLAVHPVLMAADVLQAVHFFAQLGFAPAFLDDAADPKYAGLKRDGVEIHIQSHEASSARSGLDQPVYRFLVRDVDQLYREFSTRAAGALATAETTPWHAPADTPWGTREFHVQDPDGNGLQFYQMQPLDS